MSTSWQPTADLSILKKRAALLERVRDFFKKRNILEVETPLLSEFTVTDLHIESYSTHDGYLQTSPEYAMKRLLAAGSGPIFQLCKAFRQEESGSRHNPEFTLLEWYQPKYDHHQLMDEMDAFLNETAFLKKAERLSYRDLFIQHCDIDPLNCNDNAIKSLLTTIDPDSVDRDTGLQIILSEIIEPKLGIDAPTFVFDFPASQAALAKIRKDIPPVAERFEVFINGMEIANGFHELTNPEEQENRFKHDQTLRETQKKKVPQIDHRFIDALKAGLPNCSGVALGIDRLLMCLLNKTKIADVISFDKQRA